MGRYKDPSTGTWKKEYAMPIGDTLPIGSEVDYDGSVVPYGWEQIDDNPKVLWTNPSPTAEFAGQSITLSDSIENYQYYEIIYILSIESSLDNSNIQSTGRLVGKRTKILGNDHYNRARNVTNVSGTNMTFANGGRYTSYGNSGSLTGDNTTLVPYQILGYK